MFTRAIMKELCRRMLDGWMIQEASWDPTTNTYFVSEIDAMTAACGDDDLAGELLMLFGYWSNDIQSVAAKLGVAIIDGRVVDIEPPPTAQHFWHQNKWNAPEEEGASAVEWPTQDQTHGNPVTGEKEPYSGHSGIDVAQVAASFGVTGNYGDLDFPAPNHFDPSKRGFSPK